MSASLNKKLADLRREILTLLLDIDGGDLDGLSLDQLRKVKEMQEAVNECLKGIKKGA